MLSADGLYVFGVPRSVFDALPGLEIERVDGRTNYRFWTKDAVLLGSMDICFFCNEPPSLTLDSRQQHARMTDSPARSDNQTKIQTLGAGVRAID